MRIYLTNHSHVWFCLCRLHVQIDESQNEDPLPLILRNDAAAVSETAVGQNPWLAWKISQSQSNLSQLDMLAFHERKIGGRTERKNVFPLKAMLWHCSVQGVLGLTLLCGSQARSQLSHPFLCMEQLDPSLLSAHSYFAGRIPVVLMWEDDWR